MDKITIIFDVQAKLSVCGFDDPINTRRGLKTKRVLILSLQLTENYILIEMRQIRGRVKGGKWKWIIAIYMQIIK